MSRAWVPWECEEYRFIGLCASGNRDSFCYTLLAPSARATHKTQIHTLIHLQRGCLLVARLQASHPKLSHPGSWLTKLATLRNIPAALPPSVAPSTNTRTCIATCTHTPSSLRTINANQKNAVTFQLLQHSRYSFFLPSFHLPFHPPASLQHCTQTPWPPLHPPPHPHPSTTLALVSWAWPWHKPCGRPSS